MTTDEVRAGTLAELADRRAPAHEGRDAARRGVLGRRRRVRDRRPLPASRVPAASGHRRGRASSPATGTTRASTSCRAARSTCGPTTRVASTSTSAATTCSCARACTPIPSVICRRACATGSKTTSRSSSRSRCSDCSKPACPRRRSCAPAWSSARATAARVGVRASRCSSRWPTCSPSSTADDHALALVHGLTFVARDTRNHAPRFAVGPLETQARAGRSPRELVPALRRHALVGRGRAHARDRARRTRPARRGRDDDVRGGHRPRVHRRRPHHRLHEQGVRSARPPRQGRGRPRSCPTLVRQTTGRLPLRGVRRVAPPAQPRRARPAHDRSARRRARRQAAPARAVRRASARSVGQLLDDDPEVVAAALLDALRAGADEEQLGRAIAYAAALRIARFHVQNDHGDWDTVHHAFTAANASAPERCNAVRRPSSCAARCTRRCASISIASSTCRRPACPRDARRQPRRARPLLRRAGHGRRSRQRGLRVPPRRRHARRARRRARARAARRRRRVPLVPDRRGRRPPGAAVARRIRGGGARAHGDRALPRRAHADASRAPDGRAHRDETAPRRSALRRRRRRPRSGRPTLDAQPPPMSTS